MKKATRIAAWMLTVIFMTVGLSLESFASQEVDAEFKKYGEYYLAFGDSYTRGMYGSSHWHDELYLMDGKPGEEVVDDEGNIMIASSNCRNVTGAFSKIIADTIGCKSPDDITDKSATYWPIAQNGITTASIVDLLGINDEYFDTDYTHRDPPSKSRYATNLYYFGNVNSISEDGNGIYGQTGIVDDIYEMIKKAHLITIELGMSDVLIQIRCAFEKRVLPNGITSDDPAMITRAIDFLTEQLYTEYETWKEQYQYLLNFIKAKNPEATVVIVGAVNPFFNLTLSDNTILPIGTAISAITTLMNQNYQKWAEEYGYIYVDISNVELGGSENEWAILGAFMDNQNEATHPTPDGYRQIARMILNALKEKESGQHANKDNIVVDLGHFDHADYVWVDGKPVTQYTVENHVLTIPSRKHTAKALTVGVIKNNRLSLTYYELTYHKGYTAYRVYKTNNVCILGKKRIGSLQSLSADLSSALHIFTT